MDKRHALFYLIFLQWNSKVDSTGDDVFILKTKNLTNSIRYCKDNKGEFVGGPKIFCRNVITVSSENQNSISVWTGNFKTYSPWISLLGCFKVNYTRDTTFRTPVGLQQCIDECVSRQQHTVAYNQASKWCQCGFTGCLSGKYNFDPCNQIHSDFDPLIGFFVYKVSFTLPFPNNGTETCYAQVMNTTLDVISGCSYDGYTKNNNFSGIASNIKACEPMVDEKIIYHFRDVTEKYAVNATNEELLKVNQCQVQICEKDVTSSKTLVERRCNDSADGFFCSLEKGATMTTNNITTLMEEKTTSGYTTSDWLSTKSDNQTTEGGLTTVKSTISTDESSGYESSTQHDTTPVELLSKTLNSILSSEYSSLSEAFSTNEQTVTGHSSSMTATSESTNEESDISTNSQLTTTESRQEISSKETSILSTTETESDNLSTSGYDIISTDVSSPVLSTSISIDSSPKSGSTLGLNTKISSVLPPVQTPNQSTIPSLDGRETMTTTETSRSGTLEAGTVTETIHEIRESKPSAQTTRTASSTMSHTPNKAEKGVGIKVIAGASSGIAVVILLIIIVVVVKRRHIKPHKSDKDDFLEKNRNHSYDGNPLSNDYHDITINNKSNSPFHDNNGYALVDRNFHSNDSVGKRTSGDMHIPRPQIENRSASIYSDKSEHVQLPQEENEGFYDHIQRSEKPRHSTTENAYGCYVEDSPYDITSHSQQKRRQSNYTNVQL